MGIIKNAAINDAVCEKLNKSVLTDADIFAVTELDLQRMNLTDIDDLARFYNLESLNLIENCLTDLSPLSGLVKLRVLKAGNDPFLSDEDKAKRAGINHFSDYTPLKKLTRLVDVDFTATGDDNIDYCEFLPLVEEFRAYSNPIRDISPLICCKNLRQAYFYDCPITDISVYRSLHHTVGLAMNCTGVRDISPLAGKADFSYLDAHDAKVEDISPLADFENMRWVTLAGNKIRDFSPLRGKTVGWLTLSNNPAEKEHLLDVLGSMRVVNALEIQGYGFTEEEKAELERRMSGCDITW